MAPEMISGTSNADSAPEELHQYETLSYDARLNVLDREGGTAVYERRQRIRITAPKASVFFDRVWGEGVLFRDYWTDGLDILEAIRGRNGWVVVLALPRQYSRGETFEVRTDRRIKGGFTRSTEYWDSTMFAPTRLLNLAIVSPARLRIRRPILRAPGTAGVTVEHRRNSLAMRVKSPGVYAPYRLEWAW